MLRIFAAVVAATFLGSATAAKAQSAFGRYAGTLENSNLGLEQLAKLDFIVSRQDASEMKLTAVLSLYFGSFASQEYVTYHFDGVRYDVLTGVLVFDQPDQDVTFVVRRFEGGRLEGELRSVIAGAVGTLRLRQGEEARPTKPLVQPLLGEYRGFCNGYSTRLQIQTRKFGEISAQLAEDDPDGCLSTSTSCARHVYPTGTYNFHKGILALNGQAHDLDCRVRTDGMTCTNIHGPCDLKRHSNEGATGSLHAVPQRVASWAPVPLPGGTDPVTDEPVSGIQGQYWGYVHHERLDVYQPAAFNLVTFQDPASGGGRQLKMSATAELSFGAHQSEETIAYRFNEQTYDLLMPQLVFERLDGAVDAVVQVTELKGGVLRGVWYSTEYGRVGTFVMQKNAIPDLAPGAKIMEKIAARYQSPLWFLNLRVTRPFDFRGQMRMPDITPNIEIATGHYDFYTGKFSLVLEDGSLFTGRRESRDKLYLKRPTPGIIRPLQPHEPVPFQLLDPVEPAESAREAIFEYRLRHYPAPVPCDDAAAQVAARFTDVTGRAVLSAACERSISLTTDLVVRYGGDAPLLRISTDDEHAMYQGFFATKAACEAELAAERATFEQHTGLTAVAAYCYKLGNFQHPFTARVDGFGWPRLRPVTLDRGIYSTPVVGSLTSLTAAIQAAAVGEGLVAPRTIVDNADPTFRLALRYYAPRELPIGLTDRTQYESPEQCAARQAEVRDAYDLVGTKTLVAFCAKRDFSQVTDLYTLVHTKAGYRVEPLPTRYASMAACDADRARVIQFYRDESGVDAAAALCSYYENDILNPQGHFMQVLIRH